MIHLYYRNTKIVWHLKINKIYSDRIEGTFLNITIEVQSALCWDLPAIAVGPAGPGGPVQGAWFPSLVRELDPTCCK